LNFLFIFKEILIIDDDMNSTEDEYSNITPSWMQQQLLICIISISVGTLLLFVTFIVPVAIIIRKIRRDKYELDLRELRRISDFM
jgi:uncharacterized Tic20 family protein